MIGATFCSGIGAPEMAAPWIDWRLASEIEPFPRKVLGQLLGYRDPEEHNQGDPLLWGDMATITPDLWRAHGIPLPDILVAGTPCQSFSVAGLRKGLDDDRGNLTLKFVEICHDIVAARPDGRLAVLWENVPGVLSDKGNAFGCFLGGLVGAVDALPCPADGRWPGEGMVEGPRARAAWSVLDAQWFGVAQRRRRVFVVVDFGNTIDPAAVLLEPDSLRGDTPPRRQTGQGVAASLTASTGGCSGKDQPEGRLIASHDPATTLTARESKGPLPENDLSTVIAHAPAIAIQERAMAENPASGPDGAGVRDDDTAYTLEARATAQAAAFDTTQITSPQNVSNPKPGEPCHPLASGAHPPAVAFDCKGSEAQHDTVAPPLRAMGHTGSHCNGGGHAAVATTHQVRRLTPTECHRLQGFPDDHCAIEVRGKPAADGPQYKALGNSMAVPVIRWILDRVRISAEQEKAR